MFCIQNTKESTIWFSSPSQVSRVRRAKTTDWTPVTRSWTMEIWGLASTASMDRSRIQALLLDQCYVSARANCQNQCKSQIPHSVPEPNAKTSARAKCQIQWCYWPFKLPLSLAWCGRATQVYNLLSGLFEEMSEVKSEHCPVIVHSVWWKNSVLQLQLQLQDK